MKIVLGIVAILGVAIAVVWAVASWRPRITIGTPTPEEARVKVDAAEDKAKRETAAKVEEVNRATPDDDADWARGHVRDGMRGK